MKNPTIFRNVFTVVLLVAVTASFAQNSSSAPWKKTVYRAIDLKEKEGRKKSLLKEANPGNNLAEILYDAVMMGKIQAYATYDNSLTHQMSREEVHNVLGGGKPDTISVTDPVTGIETIKVVRTDPDLELFKKFRVMEEWTFNAATGKTDIQIIAIAPIKEVYGPDGRFRGEQVFFWVMYNQAWPSVEKYDNNHPTSTFAMHIWDDYFMSDVKPKATK